MPSPTAITIYLFGLTALLAGLHGLLPLLTTTENKRAPDVSPEATANYLAAVAMGIYYPLLAHQENRAFFLATVPMRSLSAVVFRMQGWYGASAWEGAGAALTGLALLWDKGGLPSKRD